MGKPSEGCLLAAESGSERRRHLDSFDIIDLHGKAEVHFKCLKNWVLHNTFHANP
jgi:hypothetical protein